MENQHSMPPLCLDALCFVGLAMRCRHLLQRVWAPRCEMERELSEHQHFSSSIPCGDLGVFGISGSAESAAMLNSASVSAMSCEDPPFKHLVVKVTAGSVVRNEITTDMGSSRETCVIMHTSFLALSCQRIANPTWNSEAATCPCRASWLQYL